MEDMPGTVRAKMFTASLRNEALVEQVVED